MEVHSLITDTHRKLKANALIAIGLRLAVGVTVVCLLGLGLAALHKASGMVFGLLGAIFLLLYALHFFKTEWPSVEQAALSFDEHAGTKERVVSLLELADVPDSDERKQLLIKQIERQIAGTSFADAFPLHIPKRLKQSLLSLPLIWFFIGWFLAPVVLYPVYTDPVALEIEKLLAEEEDKLPEPLKESLVELAEAIDANELDSDEVLAALANAESEVDAALHSLSTDTSENERTIEADESFTTQSNNELLEQKEEVSEVQPDSTPPPTPTPQKPDEKEQKPEVTPTPEPEEKKQEQKEEQEQQPDEKDESDKKNEQSEAGDDQKGDGDSEGEGSKNSSGNKSGEGDGQQQESSGSQKNTETSGQKGQSQSSGKGDQQQQQQQDQQSDQQNKEGNSGQDSAQQQQGQQQSDSGGQKSESQESQSSSESGEQKQGEGGKGSQQQQSGPQQSVSRVKEKLDDIRNQSKQGGGDEQKNEEKSQKELDESKKNESEKKADASEENESDDEGKKSGQGDEKTGGDESEKQNPQEDESQQAPDQFNDAAWGDSGASTQANDTEPKEGEDGEKFGAVGDVGFNEVTIPAQDEKFDTRFTGKDAQRSAGKGGGKYRVELEDVELAKPEAQPGAEQQRIPLEYRSILEGE